jgi:hypothetical protein
MPPGHQAGRLPVPPEHSGIAARLIPNRSHAALIQRLYKSPRRAEDVFPTRFGFECSVCGYQNQPSSLAFSRVLYYCGVVHQHLAPGFLKPTIIAFARRQPGH